MMKTLGILCLGLLAAGLSRGQIGASAAPAVTPIRIRHEVLPVFPRDMRLMGIRDGFVLAAFGVTANGTVDDCLALAYSDEGFAEVTLANLRHWTFEPLRIGGRPVASTSQLTFNFETDGTVLVSMSGADASATMAMRVPRDTAFRTRELRELDAIPRPLSVTPPVYPASFRREGRRGTVTVDFFIDPSGTVRLPCVDPNDDQALASLAIAALQTWKFEPPQCAHKAVQVRASQVFRFQAAKAD